jgi:hypothetical protein
MKRALVHAMLGLLICITSLQGVAAVLLACCMPLPAQQHAGHGAADAALAHEGHTPAAQPEAPVAHACSACIAGCAVPAMLPEALFPLPALQAPPRILAAASAPASHVPDTPERPPRPQAA